MVDEEVIIISSRYIWYRVQYNLGNKASSKQDITLEEYQRIIEALKHKIYYKK